MARMENDEKEHGQYQTPKNLKELSESELRLEMIKKKARTKINLDKEDQNYKQILYNVTGYAKPGEVVGIMGASGSGKTSLLNILGQRLNVSPACKVEGTLSVNGNEL